MANLNKSVSVHQFSMIPKADIPRSSFNRQSSYKTTFDAGYLASLPSKIRDRFGNDPSQLLSFLADSSNKDEAISLGLVSAPVGVEVVKTE